MLPEPGDLHLASPCGEEEEFGSSIYSGQGVSEQAASNWAESVVSLTSSDEGGSSIHPACTGIVFQHTKTRACLLTSLSLFRSSDDERKISFRTETKVRLPNDQVVNGIPIFHDVKNNLSVVNVLPKGVVPRAACLDDQQQFESHSQVVCLRRCFSSGELMTTATMLAGHPTSADPEEAAAEGLFIDSFGNFVGLNCYSKEGTTSITRITILEFVAGFQKACAKKRARSADLRRKIGSQYELPMKKFGIKGRAIKLKAWSPSHMSGLEGSSTLEKKQSACHYCDPEGQSAPGDRLKRLFPGPSWPADGDGVSKEAARNKLRSRGYPVPVKHDGGMRLLCNFEEEFAEDNWSKLTKRVASHMSQSVVALASFRGDKRFFACTGIFIDCNELTTRVLTSASLVRNSDDEDKVADNLKTAQIYDQLQTEPHGEVAAVGRVYESGNLIATGGTLIDKPSELDCKELKMSTCKITKAGIGGPLIDFDGNFIGMDFYGLEETPYLPRNVVLEVLRSFDAKSGATDLINVDNPNRWPVPKPFWCYPIWHIYMGEGVDDDDLPRPIWT
ncbi:hypothetical protein ACQ4PT_066570 [Festuca glaucescens]